MFKIGTQAGASSYKTSQYTPHCSFTAYRVAAFLLAHDQG